MKAIGFNQYGGPEVLHVLDMAMPEMGEHQVLIKALAASVNYADLQTRRGQFHGANASFPIVPGLDAMGIVEKIGTKVNAIKIGTRVIAFPHSGTYAEYVVADENLVFPVPDTISFEQAAACPLVSFATYMLLGKVARLESGETVLIHAASGGIGTTAIQIARSMGAKKIIGTVGSQAKIEEAKSAGADCVISNQDDDFVAKVNEVTNGKGVDVILDSLGGAYSLRSMNCLAPYGRLIVFGNASGSYSEIDTRLLHGSCRSVLGFSSVTTRKTRPEWYAQIAPEVIRLMANGELNMKVSKTLNYEDAAEAHKMMEEKAVTGKLILKFER